MASSFFQFNERPFRGACGRNVIGILGKTNARCWPLWLGSRDRSTVYMKRSVSQLKVLAQSRETRLATNVTIGGSDSDRRLVHSCSRVGGSKGYPSSLWLPSITKDESLDRPTVASSRASRLSTALESMSEGELPLPGGGTSSRVAMGGKEYALPLPDE